MTTIRDRFANIAQQLEDLLVHPRLAAEVEAESIAHRSALQAYASLRVAAGMFDGAHAATGEPEATGRVEGQVRVLRISPETAAMFESAMRAPHGPVVVVTPEARSVLRQLWRGPKEDGDVVSKRGRDDLIAAGLAQRVQGVTSITERGRAIGREYGWVDPPVFEGLREALRASLASAPAGRSSSMDRRVSEAMKAENNAPARAAGTTPDAACSKGAPSTATAPPVAMPLSEAERATAQRVAVGPGASIADAVAVGRLLSRPLLPDDREYLAGVVATAGDRLARGLPA